MTDRVGNTDVIIKTDKINQGQLVFVAGSVTQTVPIALGLGGPRRANPDRGLAIPERHTVAGQTLKVLE